ncbi:hypothetical protein PDESU_06256 [Pontiella desulfatans]|uniref:Uncharacterized protein n=1 Tax=Pontiella desulfatans TaxID=2750659 RepID=A0A6C2UC64_PONDE|nr:hypothetical protein [Pontiella desulfatans]VGO17655.1 hypothetical protein PDESU_06256 [Pontiella desulfatans]
MAALLLAGCGEGAIDAVKNESAADSLPLDLQKLQGVWSQASTNEYSVCEVNIDGYTVRLRLQALGEETMLKRNVMISGIDDERDLLLLHNGQAAWKYELVRQETGDLLM